MYTKVIYDLGNVKEIQKYIPGNYGAPGCPREKKRKRTPEEIQKQNQRNKIRKVQRLILKNFTEGDLHLVLTYKKELRPESIEEAKIGGLGLFMTKKLMDEIEYVREGIVNVTIITKRWE